MSLFGYIGILLILIGFEKSTRRILPSMLSHGSLIKFRTKFTCVFAKKMIENTREINPKFYSAPCDYILERRNTNYILKASSVVRACIRIDHEKVMGLNPIWHSEFPSSPCLLLALRLTILINVLFKLVPFCSNIGT